MSVCVCVCVCVWMCECVMRIHVKLYIYSVCLQETDATHRPRVEQLLVFVNNDFRVFKRFRSSAVTELGLGKRNKAGKEKEKGMKKHENGRNENNRLFFSFLFFFLHCPQSSQEGSLCTLQNRQRSVCPAGAAVRIGGCR